VSELLRLRLALNLRDVGEAAHLRGSGLSGNLRDAAVTGEEGGTAGYVDHFEEAFLHRVEDLRRDVDLTGDLRLELADELAGPLLDAADDERLIEKSAVADGGVGRCQLQRRDLDVALTDSHAQRLTGAPHVLVGLELPVLVGDESLRLAAHLYAGGL